MDFVDTSETAKFVLSQNRVIEEGKISFPVKLIQIHNDECWGSEAAYALILKITLF